MKNNIAAKSNSLIEARYKLTLEEQRLILYLVSMIQPKDEDFAVYNISIKDFMETADVKNKSVYRQLKNTAENLMRKSLIIKKENTTLMMNWLSSAEYYSGQGKMALRFDPRLKPYLLKLKADFSSFTLKSVISFKSFYSIRIYELLKQCEPTNELEFTLKELRDYLYIDEKLYPMYSNFKQKVLNTAYKELREKSNVFFEFEEIKQVRKVARIKFIIHIKTDEKTDHHQPMSPEKQKKIKALREIILQSLSDSDLLSIYEAADGDMSLIEKRYGEAKSKIRPGNLVGFMIWSCKEPDQGRAVR